MQNRFVGKLFLGIAICLALHAFPTTAKAGYSCHLYRANIILKNGATIYGFFWFLSGGEPYRTGTEIQDFMKREQMTSLTIYRKLQTLRYPQRQIFAAVPKDIVEVRTSNIRTIEYLSSLDCLSESWTQEILSLPQKAINFLQKAPFASVEAPTYDFSVEVCLSYNKQVGKSELRRVCGENQEIESSPKLTYGEIQTRMRRRFDSLFNRGIIVIQIQGIT